MRHLLLLVHGFPTSSIDWYEVAPLLCRDRRVCVVDFPGFGFSDKPKDESYTVARDGALLDHYVTTVLGATSGAVVAHDRGDSVALNFAGRCASANLRLPSPTSCSATATCSCHCRA